MIHHPDEKVKLPCGFYLDSDGELSLPGLDEEWFKMNLSENCGYIGFKPVNGPRYAFKIHREVAKYFVYNPNPKVLNLVDHIDGNRSNNYYKNLRWANPQINAINRRGASNAYLVDFDCEDIDAPLGLYESSFCAYDRDEGQKNSL